MELQEAPVHAPHLSVVVRGKDIPRHNFIRVDDKAPGIVMTTRVVGQSMVQCSVEATTPGIEMTLGL